MPFYKRISKKTLKLAIIILLAAAVLLGAAFTWFGTFELAQFNTRSLTDWRLDRSTTSAAQTTQSSMTPTDSSGSQTSAARA